MSFRFVGENLSVNYIVYHLAGLTITWEPIKASSPQILICIYITYSQHKLRVVVHLYWQTALRRYILLLIIHHYFVRASCHFILGTRYRYFHEDVKFKVFLLVSKDVPFQYMPTIMDADISFECDEWDVRLAFKSCAGAPITNIDECIFE